MSTSIAASPAPCFADEQDPDPDTDPQTGGTTSKSPTTRRVLIEPEPKEG